MGASKTPDQGSTSGKTELQSTDKRTLVMARSALAVLVDAIAQMRDAGMRYSTANLVHGGREVVVMAISMPNHDVMAVGSRLFIDNRNVTSPADWDDLRDVMAEEK